MGMVAAALHLLSYGLAGWFVVGNRHVRGLCLIGIGTLCNALDAGVRLWFLGDVFAMPRPVPVAKVFSIGDLILLAGAAVTLHALASRFVWPALARGRFRSSVFASA